MNWIVYKRDQKGTAMELKTNQKVNKKKTEKLECNSKKKELTKMELKINWKVNEK